MAPMFCRECGQKVGSEGPMCPHCGVPSPLGAENQHDFTGPDFCSPQHY